ncbi:unnamed protein product [Macrosiphum euphorbiae]|uniref:Uncharacterized protein n=1 Tax=Macrosiphum euphorbiae TaxID=13131 RepID=A0AAV0Y7A6_9HEMI|nr:unnamed protein product [Macrosiphum euphorbiae]
MSITNEFLIFGQHVAAKLEKLPLEKSVFLQEKIQSMLTKARFEEIAASSTGRYTKIINETNYDYSQIEENEPETYDDDVSESENISVYYNNFT